MKRKTHKYLSRQYMLSKDYEIFHYVNKDMTNISLHHHDFYECYLFLSGEVTYFIEGRTFHLKAGDIVLINSKELHQAVINNKEATYERIVLWLSKSFLKSLCSEKMDLCRCFEHKGKKNVLRLEMDGLQSVRGVLNRLLALENYRGEGTELLYKAYVTELMVYLNNLAFNKPLTLGEDIKKSSLIYGIVDYINNHIEEDITIDGLSEEFYLSKFHLSREFKKHTGTTLHRYIVQKKLIEAKELILQNIPITEVYKQCGFGDYSNFFRAFKNEYGVTPKQFLEMMTSASVKQ